MYSFSHDFVGLKIVIIIINSFCLRFLLYLFSFNVDLNTSHCIWILVGEPKSRIVQKHTFFAPKRYTAGILYTDCLDSA